MTVIAALALGQERNIEAICLVADSRVSVPHPKGRFVAKTDTGHKLYHIYPNVFIGFAGDYRHATTAISDFSKYYNNRKAIKPMYQNRGDIIAGVFARRVRDKWQDSYAETDFVLGIEDLTVGQRQLFVVSTQDFGVRRLDAGLHLFGPEEAIETEFRKTYKGNLAFMKPWSLAEYANVLIATASSLNTYEVGGLISCLVMHPTGHMVMDRAMSPDEGKTFIVDAHNDDGTVSRKVNGKLVESTLLNPDEVQKRLTQPYRKS